MSDALLLQQDLHGLDSWSKKNGLDFNVAKCHVVHFSRRRVSCIHDYDLSGTHLSAVDSMRDLGVIFSSDLSFDRHISHITTSAFKKLGFINRSCKLFSDVQTLKLLYCSLVRPQLEFASIIWSPFYSNRSALLEKIQHCFLRRISYKLGKPMSILDHDYDHVMKEINFLTLKDRRVLLDLVFISKIVNGSIDCSELLERIGLHVPGRTLRSNQLFSLEAHRTSYGMHKPLNRLCSLANDFAAHIDLFNMNPNAIKRALIRCFI